MFCSTILMKKQMNIENDLAKQLENRKNVGGYRQLRLPADRLIDFSSNDYLGLAQSEEVYANGHQFVDNGSAGSRLLSGNKQYHVDAEEYIRDFFHAEAALLFNSGYMANLGVLSCIPQKGDTVLMDELSHICMKEGVRLSRAKYFNFKHNDLADLRKKLNVAEGNVFIVVESVYSMNGDQAPLVELLAIAKEYKAAVIVDEAHSTGLYGEVGAGLCCSLGVENEVFARIYTFGKAVGAHGAAVVGSQVLKDYLINYSRQFIYTTALPYHSVRIIQNALVHRKKHPELWTQLQANIELFRKELHPEINRLDSQHPIQGVLLDNVEQTLSLAKYLQESGFDIRPILSPTVPKGQERIRICLHAFNSAKEVSSLCHHINQYFK